MGVARKQAILGLLTAAAFLVIGLVGESVDIIPSYVPVHVLLSAAVVIAAFYGGAGGAALALILIVAGIGTNPDMSASHFTGWIIESGIAGAVTVGLRGRVRRMLQSETKLRALLASMNDVIMVLDADGRYVEVVSKLPDAGSDRTGHSVHEFVPGDLADTVMTHVHRALIGRQTINVDYSWPVRGVLCWFNASITPLSGNKVLWVARDVTARRSAEVELEQRVEERTSDLRESEARFRSVIEQAEEIIFTMSRQGILTSLNPAFERSLGMKIDEWLGRNFIELVVSEQRDEVLRVFAARLTGVTSPMTRATVVGFEGRRLTLEVRIVPQIIQGAHVGFVGIARDVSEREQAEEALRRKKRQLAQAQRVAHLGSWERDLSSKETRWSEELFGIFGLEPHDRTMYFEQFLERIEPQDRDHMLRMQKELLANGRNDWEVRARRADDRVIVLRCSAVLIADEQTQIVRMIGTAQDVTAEKEAEQRLRESEERFNLLARATNDGVWDLDLRTQKVWRNSTYEALFGYPNSDLPDFDSWTARIHAEDRDRTLASYREAMETGADAFSLEYQFLRADGTYAFVLDRVHIVRDDRKVPVRLLGSMTDMTERKQLEEQLQQAQRVSSLGRVAASIAHEFNNVLMGIQPNVELLKRKAPDELRAVTDRIVGSVQRGKRITEEILRFTRPVEPAIQPIHVHSFLDRRSEEIRSLLGPAIALNVEVSDDVHIAGDALQLAQVFANLALNARDAMPRGGAITIAADLATSFAKFHFGVVRTADRFVHLAVRDEGSGITRERLSHIFEPLFTTKKGGVGLGLAITYQIVKRHGGHIFVESEVDRGTTFHLFLPAAVPAIAVGDVEKDDAGTVRRVLLVEDEEAVASGIAMLLQMDGTMVELARSGAEAVPAIERFGPDVVVLDIGLPDMDGVDVYRLIEKRWPKLPVLFSSGHADSAKIEQDLARPNIGFLLKPYDFDVLREQLSRLAERAHAAA